MTPRLKRRASTVAPNLCGNLVIRSVEIVLVDTPGVTAANLSNFDYQRRRRRLYRIERQASYAGD
jgi:hypothetical protein